MCTGRTRELGVPWLLHIYKGSAATVEPHIRLLTAIDSGYGFMWLSWCRTVEEKTDREAMLALRRIREQEQGCLLPSTLPFLPVPLCPDRTAVCLQAK